MSDVVGWWRVEPYDSDQSLTLVFELWAGMRAHQGLCSAAMVSIFSYRYPPYPIKTVAWPSRSCQHPVSAVSMPDLCPRKEQRFWSYCQHKSLYNRPVKLCHFRYFRSSIQSSGVESRENVEWKWVTSYAFLPILVWHRAGSIDHGTETSLMLIEAISWIYITHEPRNMWRRIHPYAIASHCCG